MRALTVCAVLALTACASVDPVRVEVPVAQRAIPPDELRASIPTPGRIFAPPGSAGVVACVDPAGRDALVSYVDLLRQRLDAWEAWTAP